MATFYPPIDWTEHPLHAAAFGGNRADVERLIADGADVNGLLHRSVNGGQGVAGAPLHVALLNCHDDASLYRGHHEVVEALLAAGADVGLCRLWEGTPLHDAARFGLTRIAGRLIAHGADVNSNGDYQGRAPLHLAAANGHLGMVDYLLGKGAAIDAAAGGWFRCDPATSPYWRQYNSGSSERVLAPNIAGETPLQVAASEGQVEVVKRLLERGACLDIAGAIGLATRSKGWHDTRFDEIIGLLRERQQRNDGGRPRGAPRPT